MSLVERMEASVDRWAGRIKAAWQKSTEAIIETGHLIAQAKAELPHGQFMKLIDGELPFKASTAQRLMKIAADERLSNAAHVQHLPPSWGTLYELTKLDDAMFEHHIRAGIIRPDMERKEITHYQKALHRQAREIELAARQKALPAGKHGVIYADPEWEFATWSEAGKDRAAENHYPTSSTAVIASRPVEQLAADDCALFLWATAPMLPAALEVMAAWGFAYKTHLVWDKIDIGTGYWFRGQHELLLVGMRGSVPAPAPGTQWPSIIRARKGVHSAKPDEAYELIEAYYPALGKIELNARRRRDGWTAWGLEAPDADAPTLPAAAEQGRHPQSDVDADLEEQEQIELQAAAPPAEAATPNAARERLDPVTEGREGQNGAPDAGEAIAVSPATEHEIAAGMPPSGEGARPAGELRTAPASDSSPLRSGPEADRAAGAAPLPVELAFYEDLVRSDPLKGKHTKETAAPIIVAAYGCVPLVPIDRVAADLGHKKNTVLSWAFRLGLSDISRRSPAVRAGARPPDKPAAKAAFAGAEGRG